MLLLSITKFHSFYIAVLWVNMHGKASLAALKYTQFLYLCICYRQCLKNDAVLTNFLIYRPFLLVFFTLYQRDKHLKKAMVPVPFSIPVSCTINRLLPMRSCSNTQRLSQQVCCTHTEPILCSFASLRVRQLHLTEGFVMLPALLEVKPAQIFTPYFNSFCKVPEFKRKFQRVIRLLFTFIASFIIVHSLPLFSYLKFGLFLLTSVSTFLVRKGKALLTKNAGKSNILQRCLGKCVMAKAHPPAPSAAVLRPWGLPQLHTSRARRGALAITFQSISVWKRWQNTLLHAAALKGFGASDAFLRFSFWTATRTFPSICS